MFSTSATSSSRLNPGFSAGYQSINPQSPEERVNDAAEEEVRIPIPNDEPIAPSFNEQMPEQPQGEEQGEQTGRFFITAEQLRQGKPALLRSQAESLHNLVDDFKRQGRYARAGSVAFNLSALAALVTMKVEGHLDEHPNYFGWLLAFMGMSYLMLNGVAVNLGKQANLLKENVKVFPVFEGEGEQGRFVTIEELNQANSSLILTQTTLRIRAEQLELLGKVGKYTDTFFNSAALIMLLTMTFKGYFDKHPYYFAVLLIGNIFSSAMLRSAYGKFNKYAGAMNEIAGALPAFRAA